MGHMSVTPNRWSSIKFFQTVVIYFLFMERSLPTLAWEQSSFWIPRAQSLNTCMRINLIPQLWSWSFIFAREPSSFYISGRNPSTLAWEQTSYLNCRAHSLPSANHPYLSDLHTFTKLIDLSLRTRQFPSDATSTNRRKHRKTIARARDRCSYQLCCSNHDAAREFGVSSPRPRLCQQIE